MIRILIPAIISVSALGFALYLILNRKQKSWTEMTDGEKKRKKLLILGSLAVFVAGLITAFSLRKKD
jgi:hypothetical protein